MPEVLMPRLSDSMEEGVVVRWLVEDGAEVQRGQEIAEIETDKATMPYEADAAGVLRRLAEEGATLAVGMPIATIGADAGTSAATNGRSASPVARRLARALGVALEHVQGSGPRGRILKADVRAAAGASAAAAPAAARSGVPAPPAADPAPSPEPVREPEPEPAREPEPGPVAVPEPAMSARGAVEHHALSRMQQAVARRMSEARATVPDFFASVDVDMEEALALRERLAGRVDPAPSLNDVLVKVAATVLRRHPRVNGAYRDGRLETYERVNVGIAVAAGDGLLVPTLRDADTLSLGTVARESRRLAARARSGEITPPELAGGTFTVSNLGMFGVDRFAGIITPPQAAILCAGAVTRRPAVAPDGTLQARSLMTLTLVSDHRIVYGADAARFLADLRLALEDPIAALV